MTAHEDAAQQAGLDMMSRPDGPEALGVYYEGLREGRWPRKYLDVIGQDGSRAGAWDLGQMTSFAYFHAEWMAGGFGCVELGLVDPPGGDADRVGNAAKLADLPDPFVAHVDMTQNNADQDGFLEWTDQIFLHVSTGEPEPHPGGGEQPRMTKTWVKPRTVPLEIGTTKPSRTWLHMQREGAVARWPYGHDRITVFVNLGR